MFRAAFPALLALAMVGGCAQPGDFPSLKPRPVEQLTTDEPVRTAPMVAPDPALSAQISELLAQARRGESDFETALPTARARVTAAGARESESWVMAQQALSRLEAARAETVVALGDLDRLALAEARNATNADQYQALRGALETVASMAGAQHQEIERLRASL